MVGRELQIVGRNGNIVEYALIERKQADLDKYERLIARRAELAAEYEAKAEEIAKYDEKIAEYDVVIEAIKAQEQTNVEQNTDTENTSEQ